MKNNTFCWNFN